MIMILTVITIMTIMILMIYDYDYFFCHELTPDSLLLFFCAVMANMSNDLFGGGEKKFDGSGLAAVSAVFFLKVWSRS